ncbi:hypothetical protein K438DRAFT_2140517 [Mycena galopus ATCC 62051]|nr:hypothetical protein K438DRAFT_2140517 [Mycena galopus ATCC 62051]
MSNHNDDENDEQETWFARGERSGISVQNPASGRRGLDGDLLREMLRRAQEEDASSGEPAQSTPNLFTGGGHTLGGEGTSSGYVPEERCMHAPFIYPSKDCLFPPAFLAFLLAVFRAHDLAIRRLTFWRDDFIVEDGSLTRYDDPANADILAAIHAGYAPPSILSVRHGQRFDVQVTQRTSDDYVSPPPKPTAAASDNAAAATSGPISFEVDQTQPTMSVQIRLADGIRIVCRMNLTHRHQPENLTRYYTIGTTFPNRILEDNTATIKEAGLANSVVVQRWV